MKSQDCSPGGLDLLLELVALEQVEERDEDRDLQQQRQAGGERVDVVLLVHPHHLALQALAVVLVLSWISLICGESADSARIERICLTESGRIRARVMKVRSDDRRAVDEADVVQEVQHRVGDVDQRLQDVGDEDSDELDHRPGTVRRRRMRRCGVRRGRACGRQTSSMPPSLNGLQRRTRQPATIEPRTGPSSRIASAA